MAEPIFLMCSERSGSNLITRMFNSHSQYCAPSSVHLMRVLGENLFRYGDLRSPGNWFVFVDDCIALFDAKIGVWKTETADFERLAAQAAVGSAGALILALYRAEADANGKASFFIKENHIYKYASFILEACPTARFVYLVRDPRDMALSWLKAAALRGGPVRAAAVWANDQAGFLTLCNQLTATRRTSRLTYEALTDNAASALQRVCDELDVGYEPDMLAFYRDEGVIANANEAVEWRNISRPVMSSNSGKFTAGLRPDQIAFVEATCRDLMPVFGYDATVDRPADLRTLTDRLAAEEPYEKPAYQKVPAVERERRKQWQAVADRIRSRLPP